MNDFGSRLQKLRKQRGMTQKSLAERINKSHSAISSYETNMQMPPLDVLISIASVLNVSLDYLAGTNRKDVLSLEGLSPSQKDLIFKIVTEFRDYSSKGKPLTSTQRELMDNLLQLFYGLLQ